MADCYFAGKSYTTRFYCGKHVHADYQWGQEKEGGTGPACDRQEEGLPRWPCSAEQAKKKDLVMMAGAAARKTPCRHTKTKNKSGKQNTKETRRPLGRQGEGMSRPYFCL